MADQETKSTVQQAFAEVDRHDPKALRKFFLLFSFFTSNDMALMLELNARTIRKLKKRAGLGRVGGPPQKPPGFNYGKIVDIPIDWYDDDSLRAAYPRFGYVAISKAVGISYTRVKQRIKKMGIGLSYREACRSKHPCCTAEWLRKHYIEMGLTQVECAKLAGVSDCTIRDWLNFHGTQVRTHFVGPPVGKTCGVGIIPPQNDKMDQNQ